MGRLTRTAISLFAGAGGSCSGLKLAGLNVLASVERDTDALATLALNGLPAYAADLFDFDVSALPQVDVIEGGPPCQPFSAGSSRNGLGEWDARDGIPAYIAAVSAVRPSLFVMENVRGLTFAGHADYLARVLGEFSALGYAVDYRVLDAADFGVPQNRRRLFVVGRLDGGPKWPESEAARTSMADALRWNGWNDDDRIGFPRKADTQGAATSDGYRARDFRYGRDLAFSVTSKIRSYKRWPHGRLDVPPVRFSQAEAAALQDFPPGWGFAGSPTSAGRQIGNACPRRLTAAVVGANL